MGKNKQAVNTPQEQAGEKNSALGFWCRVICGGALLASGFLKLIVAEAEFSAVITSYSIVSPESAAFIARTLPWVEFYIGGFLMAGIFTRFFARIAVLFYSAFAFSVLIALLRGTAIRKSHCLLLNFHPLIILLFAAALAAISLGVLRYGGKKFSIDKWARGG
ncbi:MAG: hypothetical protein NTW04_03200 [Elusimicrobia bacterium]|nr:hypothetical protein [Elusimicrobiota bacterium]